MSDIDYEMSEFFRYLKESQAYIDCNKGDCKKFMNKSPVDKLIFLGERGNNVDALCNTMNKDNLDNTTTSVCAQLNKGFLKRLVSTIDKSKELTEDEYQKTIKQSARYILYNVDPQSFVLMLFKRPEMVPKFHCASIFISSEDLMDNKFDE